MSADLSAPLVVTPETRISEVLQRYGDMADVMENFGVKRVGPYDVRRLIGRLLTVRRAATIHGLSVDEMVARLQAAIEQVHRAQSENPS